MKRNEEIEIVFLDGERVKRKVGDVNGYLTRMTQCPVGTRVVHHRKSGGKTWFVKLSQAEWVVEKVTYA